LSRSEAWRADPTLQEGAALRAGDARGAIKIAAGGDLLGFSGEIFFSFRWEGVAPARGTEAQQNVGMFARQARQ
jgi:hypothetical protein